MNHLYAICTHTYNSIRYGHKVKLLVYPDNQTETELKQKSKKHVRFTSSTKPGSPGQTNEIIEEKQSDWESSQVYNSENDVTYIITYTHHPKLQFSFKNNSAVATFLDTLKKLNEIRLAKLISLDKAQLTQLKTLNEAQLIELMESDETKFDLLVDEMRSQEKWTEQQIQIPPAVTHDQSTKETKTGALYRFLVQTRQQHSE